VQPCQRRSAGGELGPVGVEQPNTEGLQHARTAIRRGTAADPQNDPPRTGVECGSDQLADTVRARRQRGRPWEQADAGGRGQLQDGDLGIERNTASTGRPSGPDTRTTRAA
jgi:hypothetical protein